MARRELLQLPFPERLRHCPESRPGSGISRGIVVRHYLVPMRKSRLQFASYVRAAPAKINPRAHEPIRLLTTFAV